MKDSVVPQAKLIFVVGSCTNKWPHTLQRGAQFTTGLLKHNLRISTRRCWSYIDSDRSHLNLVRRDESQVWQSIANQEQRQVVFKDLSARFYNILAWFKTELQARNERLRRNKQYCSVKTWPQYISNKNVTGEWIIAASRSWFVMNELIRTDNDRKFRVFNQAKMLVWADHVHRWAQRKIKHLFHRDAYLASFLHLDESNVHIHCQHVQFMYKFDGRQQKMVHTFTRPKAMTPVYLSQLRQDLYQYLMTELKNSRYPWAPMMPSHDPKTGLALYQFKINDLQTQVTKLQQQIKHHQLQSQLQIDLTNHRFNQELMRIIRTLDRLIVEQIYIKLLRAGYDQVFLQQHLLLRTRPMQLPKTLERNRCTDKSVARDFVRKIC